MKPLHVALILGLFLLPRTAGAQKLDADGKPWLASHAEPAAINVHGIYEAKSWGTIVLNQAAQGRDVSGRGDDWQIIGVVSGTRVYLLFVDGQKVGYSAILSQQGEGVLQGRYGGDLMKDESKGRGIELTRTVPKPAAVSTVSRTWIDYMPEVPAAKAFVYVYRNYMYGGRARRPSVYCDDGELARIGNATYFIVKVAPGTHKFRSNDKDKTEVTVDAKAGEKHYVRVDLTGWGHGKVVAASAEEGEAGVRGLIPIDASQIVDTKTVLVPGFDQTGPSGSG